MSKCDHPVIPEKSLDEVFLWLEYLKEMEDKKEELNEQEIDSGIQTQQQRCIQMYLNCLKSYCIKMFSAQNSF